jgi:hypothetical protein
MIFILNGLKAEKPGKLVIHQRVGMNGFVEFARSPK